MSAAGVMASIRAMAVSAISVVALAGCALPSPGDGDQTPTPADAIQATPSVQPAPPRERVIDNADGRSQIATALAQEITIFDSPGGEVMRVLSATEVLTDASVTPLVFLVKEFDAGWVEVYLPLRPNGSTGWVDATEVAMSATRLALEVRTSAFELAVVDGGEVVAVFPVALGIEDRPTPGGIYFVKEALRPLDQGGPYGPYALGLSGYSPTLESYLGGEAVIGIHGTNDPGSIGSSVSSGCVRMHNDDIRTLVEQFQIPLGTPVVVLE